MKHLYPIVLFACASVLSGVAFADIPEKKQKNPGIAACKPDAPPGGSAAGIAITEEGGPNQHADRPKGKGIVMSAPGGAEACPGGSGAGSPSSAPAAAATPPAKPKP
jgi:hypothetical protein